MFQQEKKRRFTPADVVHLRDVLRQIQKAPLPLA
jgi:hypothetical protein